MIICRLVRLLAVSILLAVVSFAVEPRTVIRLGRGWKFQRGDSANASATTFDANPWQSIMVPHTWNTDVDPPPSGYYRGPGWYRNEFVAPAQWKGRRVFVRFEAASLVAKVFLNGKELGEHKGGFAAFCFELTPYLTIPGKNVLAVRVDNSLRQDVSPLRGDFTAFGGLYRPVSLIVTAPVNITLRDYASPGVYLRQASVTPQRAEVETITKVDNGTATARNLDVAVTIRDAQGRKVTAVRGKVQVPANGSTPVSQMVVMDNPHLWNGVADPYLYTARIELSDGRKVIDAVEQPLGLRYFQLDPQRGFVLNGKPQQMHGVNRHQDWAGLGWAITEKEQDADMSIMREMGVNSVRLAHYQHNEYFYRLCDREGLLVWAELAMVDYLHNTPEFRENVRQQLTELIRQNFNHPSIAMWSLYNEIRPANTDDPVPIVAELKQLAKAEDPGRPTTGALSFDGIQKLHSMGQATDILALNVYPGWYIQTPPDMGPIIDKWNEAYGSKGIIISEYGAGASIHQHQQEFIGRSGRAPADWHPEEWQSIVHEANYAAIKARPFVFGSFVWNMFDFASATRTEGDTFFINDKGLVTRDRKIRKDAYYFYQANWTTKPMLHITSRRDTERAVAETHVKVYSNCDHVTLKVNGRSYARRAGNDLHVFEWTGIQLAEGENRIEAEAHSSAGALHDEVTWTYHQKQTAGVTWQNQELALKGAQ